VCGVFGFAGNLPRRHWHLAHRLLVELATASEERGTDAAGFAALTADGGLLWQRQPGPARFLFRGDEFAALRHRTVTMAIGHTRLATRGAPAANGNNHPHLAGDWSLVHNGWIPRHEQKAALLGLRLHSQCDSEILVHVLNRRGETEGPDMCLALGGKQSVLAINARRRVMLAWTNGEMPLVAFRVEGLPALWWASTEAIAERALRRVGHQAVFATAEPGVVYRIEVTDRVVVTRQSTEGIPT
jgi:glucosamine 6-phosphate synthetase-like amidotransferase/phosphosugar isomerase protein